MSPDWKILPAEIVSYIIEFFVHPKDLVRGKTVLTMRGVPIQTYLGIIDGIPTIIKWYYHDIESYLPDGKLMGCGMVIQPTEGCGVGLGLIKAPLTIGFSPSLMSVNHIEVSGENLRCIEKKLQKIGWKRPIGKAARHIKIE